MPIDAFKRGAMVVLTKHPHRGAEGELLGDSPDGGIHYPVVWYFHSCGNGRFIGEFHAYLHNSEFRLYDRRDDQESMSQHGVYPDDVFDHDVATMGKRKVYNVPIV